MRELSQETLKEINERARKNRDEIKERADERDLYIKGLNEKIKEMRKY